MKTRAIKVMTLVLGIILISSSCTIQKRRYLKGYYVSWNKNFNSKHQASKTNRLNVKKNIKKISLNHKPTSINTHKKKEIQILKKRKTTPNQLENKNVKKSSNNTLKNNINPHKIETKQQYTIDVVTDSTITNNEQTKNHIVPIENEQATNALIVFLLSIFLFIFGGFIAIIFSYFMAVKGLNQIRENPKIYKKGEKTKALAIIILYNVFAFALLAVTSIVMFFDTLIFYFFIAALIYALFAIIGLFILRKKTLERKHQNKQHTTTNNNNNPNQEPEKTKKESPNKKSNKQLAIFLLISLLSFGLYFIIN